MDSLTQDKIIKGFIENDYSVLSELYNLCFPVIEKFIIFNAGSDDDAKDIFQDALMIVLQKIKNNDFVLSCSLMTYVYSIVKNMWMKELRIRKGNEFVINDVEEFEDIDFYVSFEKEYSFNTEYFIFRKHYLILGKTCRQILRMYLEKIPYNEMAKILKLKTEGIVRRRKFRCKERLVKSIKKDPEYQKYLERNAPKKTK